MTSAIDDQLNDQPHIWKISNSHIAATVHPIHFMFASCVRFSGSADRMVLFPFLSNPRWQPATILENSNDQISPPRVICSTYNFTFVTRVGLSFQGQIDFLFDQIKNAGRQPSWKILNEYITGMGYSIHFYEIDSSTAVIRENNAGE